MYMYVYICIYIYIYMYINALDTLLYHSYEQYTKVQLCNGISDYNRRDKRTSAIVAYIYSRPNALCLEYTLYRWNRMTRFVNDLRLFIYISLPHSTTFLRYTCFVV